MKIKIALSTVVLSLIAVCFAGHIALAEPAWLESSYRAAAALKGGNLESAQEYLAKALPDVAKMSEAAIESTGRKLDVEGLCTTYDGWKRASEAALQEKNKLKRLEKKPEAANKESFQNQMTEMRQNIDEQIKAGKTNLNLLELAIDIRKKVYPPQDQTTLGYQSELRAETRGLDALKNLRPITEVKTREEMAKLITTPSPEMVFASNFSTPSGQISGLKGGGYAWQGHDVWIRFKSSQPVALKSDNVLSNVNSRLSVIAGQFLKVCPEDSKELSETEGLEVSQGTGNVGSKWVLLSNKKRGFYWFRHWGGD